MLNLLQNKYVRYAIALFAAGIVVWLVVSLLTTTTLRIKTNDAANVISIQQISPHNKSINIGNAKGNFTTRLGHGTYVITAKNGYASAQQIIKLSGIIGSQSATVNVDKQANAQGTLEAMSDFGAYSIVADSNSVKFLDRNQNPARLYQIDANNTLATIPTNTSFESIVWADTSFGVGRTIIGGDEGSTLMTITGNTIGTMNLPITATTFTVAPNHDVYISDGRSLYRGMNGTNFIKVFTADSSAQIKVVSASKDSVLLTSKVSSSSRGGELITLHTNESKQAIDGEAYEGAWSKSGDYLAVTGDSTMIFNKKLEKVVSLPISNIGAIAWLDDNTLVYADGNLVWRFSVTDHQASVLTTTSNGVGTVSEIAPSSDGSSLYIAVQNADISNGYTFYLAHYRFNSHVATDPALQKISLALPNSPIAGCRVGYVNFTRLAIAVHAAAAIQQPCIAAARDYLQSYNINPDALVIQFVPDF